MPTMRGAAALGAAAMLTAQPCLAADAFNTAAPGERRSAGFAGVQVKLPIGTGRTERPSARLQLGMVHQYRDAGGSGLVRTARSPGLEFGLDRRGHASFLAGGRELRLPEQRLNAKGSTTTWLIVGGVVVLGVIVLAAVAGAQPTPGPGEGAFD